MKTIRSIIDTVQQDLDWHIADYDKNLNLPPLYKDGFIDGIKQTLIVLEKIEDSLNDN